MRGKFNNRWATIPAHQCAQFHGLLTSTSEGQSSSSKTLQELNVNAADRLVCPGAPWLQFALRPVHARASEEPHEELPYLVGRREKDKSVKQKKSI